MKKIKKIIYCIIAVLFIFLGTTVIIQNNQVNNLTKELYNASANEKALLLINDSNKNQIRSL
jgi:uncharacterized membrane protein affecting hemolysin expression